MVYKKDPGAKDRNMEKDVYCLTACYKFNVVTLLSQNFIDFFLSYLSIHLLYQFPNLFYSQFQ